ncbi:TonB-dependent receptor [Shewanella sp. 3_MG-2023]|uniref:TonB-dependent receptor n=1 Tax=Shewanella sp. 3_MG-2023 TaxID=3062635 RepID=UPI0026E139ED|nr:TonB-dependent receptor [Shewanella sp. 3_MG-2023]MDO6775779.1 TonB-dependent receptor [Shewanella sp. 3_MG-2023]
MKHTWLAVILTLSILSVSSNARAETDEQKFKPSTALLVDFIDSRGDMFGITLAMKHFDPDYADWGYYIGYAWGDKYDLDVPEPAEAYAEEYMWRFGLSYSLTENFNLYGGATVFINEQNYTNNISTREVNGKPRWESNRDKNWGAEVGVRYTVFDSFVIGAGYDTSAEAAIISIGFTM